MGVVIALKGSSFGQKKDIHSTLILCPPLLVSFCVPLVQKRKASNMHAKKIRLNMCNLKTNVGQVCKPKLSGFVNLAKYLNGKEFFENVSSRIGFTISNERQYYYFSVVPNQCPGRIHNTHYFDVNEAVTKYLKNVDGVFSY